MRKIYFIPIYGGSFLALVFLLSACKKLLSIPPPTNSVTSSQVFSTDQEATEAMAGVYNLMINNYATFFNWGMPIYAGASADELDFFQGGSTQNIPFQKNAVLSTSNVVELTLWSPIYSAIYGCNSVISGTEASGSIHDSVKNELIGEAEFSRALANFYLVNLFGAAPLVTSINYNTTSLLGNTSPDTLYAAIIADLKDAQARLPGDYSVGGGQRIIPNKWAATALLARVYLYRRDWADAATQATTVIGQTGLYQIVPGLDSVFLVNSSEAIWQLQQSNRWAPSYSATPLGYEIIPIDNTTQPFVYMTPSLLNAFDSGDNRRIAWIDSTVYLGVTYYYPYKYKDGPAQASPNGNYNEYYMVLRLAEQFLIRAEAEANGAGGGIGAAAADLNVIRNRAGLSVYGGSMDQDSILGAIYHERRVELFSEWGTRWLDLKRWNLATAILSAEKGQTVTKDDLLYPIPLSEILRDPNLSQNAGY